MSSDTRLVGLTCECLENPLGIGTPGAGAGIRLPEGSTPLVAGSGQRSWSCNLAQNT